MSSVISQKKYQIVLFQGGLADKGHFFDEAISALTATGLGFRKYPERIDMTDYNSASGCFYRRGNGYFSKSLYAENEFQTLIANIVECAKMNADTTILVHTYLNHGFNSEHDLETIENQKIRLVRIIKEFKRYGDIDISLVGHSQGGLVNLEAATEVPDMIKQLISLSTPYAPVYLAEKLIFLDFYFKIGGAIAYALFKVKSENMSAYDASVKTLASSLYFDDLHNRWNALPTRPKLTVVTGTSGLIYNVITTYDPQSQTSTDTITTEPFDGLVKISEQKAIEHADFIHLVKKDVPCLHSKKYAESVCSLQTGLYIGCKESCTLSSISFSGTIANMFFSLIDNAIRGNGLGDFSTYPIVVAIDAGRNREPAKVPSGGIYQAYYNIYSDEYNHENIAEAPETIGKLAALLV